MFHRFKIERTPPSPTRKIPLLPRFGFVIDIAGHRISFRQVPFTETLINLWERGATSHNLRCIIAEQFQEIRFPFKNQKRVVDVAARTVMRRSMSK